MFSAVAQRRFIVLRHHKRVLLPRSYSLSTSCHSKHQTKNISDELQSDNENSFRLELNRLAQTKYLNDTIESGQTKIPLIPGMVIAPLHEEVEQDLQLPTYIDKETARQRLQLAFESARATPMRDFSHTDPTQKPSRGCILNRVGSNWKSGFTAMHEEPTSAASLPTPRQPAYGDVHLTERNSNAQQAATSYDTRRLFAFGNAPASIIPLVHGETHVGVGFCDIAQLLFATCSGIKAKGAACFNGYDAVPYNVARSLVVVQMCRMNAPVYQVIEVAFSSIWSSETVSVFGAAITHCIPNVSCKAVNEILSHWLEHCGVSVNQASAVWLSSSSNAWLTGQVLSQWRSRKDRIAVAAYSLSGDVFCLLRTPDDKCVGSTIMFGGLPNDTSCLPNQDHNFLSIFHDEHIVQHRKLTPNIIEAAIHCLHTYVLQLIQRLCNKELRVELHQGVLGPDSWTTHAAIREHSPSTMSWSNVCDYIDCEEFHHGIVEQCSRSRADGGTRHIMYSMNWVREVFGTFIIDTRSLKERLVMLGRARDELQAKVHPEVLKLLHQNPMLVTAEDAAESLAQERYHKNWSTEFLAKSSSKLRRGTEVQFKRPLFQEFRGLIELDFQSHLSSS